MQASEAAPTIIEGVITGLAPVSTAEVGWVGQQASDQLKRLSVHNLRPRILVKKLQLILHLYTPQSTTRRPTQGRHGLHLHVYGDVSEGLTGAGELL